LSGSAPNESTLSVYDNVANVYDRGRTKWYKELLKLVASRVNEPVLDAGCGTGYIACSLAQLGATHVVCLDISTGMLFSGKRRAQRLRLTAFIEFIQGSIERLPFRDKVFRTTLATAVIHHLEKREARVDALIELKRVSRGFVLVTVWSALSPSNIARIITSLSRDVKVRWGGKGERYYHLYTPMEFREDLRRAGYKRFKLYLWDYKPILFKRNIVVEYYAGDS